MDQPRPSFRSAGLRARPIERAGASLAVSALLHGAVLGLGLAGWWPGDASTPPTAPRIVLVDLDPVAASPPGESVLPTDGEREADSAATALASQVETLTGENAELAARLAEERERTAQLEAQHRQEIAALESARSRLGEELAAVTADRETLSAEVAASRERAAALEQELEARRQAEAAALADVRATYDRLVEALRSEIAEKDVALERARQGLTVAIVDRVLFPSGQASLTAEGEAVIDKVSTALAAVSDRRLLIEGHTDNVPIGPDLRSRYASNWELSTARATEVVRRLIDHGGLPPARLSAVGRADTEPVAPNDTEEGRRRNRRIEIVLLPPEAAGTSEIPAP